MTKLRIVMAMTQLATQKFTENLDKLGWKVAHPPINHEDSV